MNAAPIMKFSSLFLLTFIAYASRMNAQFPYSNLDSVAVFNLIDKADVFFLKNVFDSALSNAKQAIGLAKERKFYRGEAWALIKATEILVEQKELTLAEQYALQVYKLGNRLKDSMLDAVSIMQLAQVKMYDDRPDEAIILFNKALGYNLDKSQNKFTALAYNDLGYTWGRKDEYEKQAEFTTKALKIYEELKNDAGAAMALGNLSAVYFQMGQKAKAVELGKQSLYYREKIGDVEKMSVTCCNLSQYFLGIDTDEATKYQQLCVKYALQSGNESRVIHSYITSSLLANNKKNNTQALEYELKVIALLEKSHSDQKMLARRYIAAAFYNDVLKLDSLTTLAYFNRSIDISLKSNDRNNLKDVYSFMSDYYQRKKNYEESYKSYKKHITYRDSILNVEKETMIADIQTKYETGKKDNEIAKLNSDQRIQQLEIEKQKVIIMSNALTALQKQSEVDLLSKSQELQNISITQQADELEKHQLKAKTNAERLDLTEKVNQLQLIQLKNQKNIRNLLFAGMSFLLLFGLTWRNRYTLKKKLEQQNSLLAMRNNISHDLHDDIGASLSNINILNELAQRNINQPEKSKEYLFKAAEDIQSISESLSDIVWNINPLYDDLKNLFVRMKRYAADMLDGKNINGQFDFPANESNLVLSMTQRRDLYLIFKEAVNNLVKYSEAKNAIIQIKTGEQKIEMNIRDDGKGFDRDKVRMGNGLQNMVHRAKASGANVLIQSHPGKGTFVKFEMKIR